jgi:VIT1/CCC1 family predicted Fe2+/Mn2+ transporter
MNVHARDEIGITTELSAQPIQAAIYSAASFSMGAAVPVVTTIIAPVSLLLWLVPILAIGLLGALGGGLQLPLGGASLSWSCSMIQ